MAINLKSVGKKLFRLREQFQYTLSDVESKTGIQESLLRDTEAGSRRPSGDEILILADFYKCDYKFFLSNEELTPLEQTETLFRKFGDEFSSNDRWAVQECLYLAECESYLEIALGKQPREKFTFTKHGEHFKTHGKEAAKSLRVYLKYPKNEVSMNIYNDMRRIGIRVFRRKLENSNISGMYINHPIAGQCVLINYSEDVYRQRFTAAHEAAHTILDNDEDVLVSFSWDKKDLKEVRANAFASAYLVPPEFLTTISTNTEWTQDAAIKWANKLKISTHALAIALSENRLINSTTYSEIVKSRVPKREKVDPELPIDLPIKSLNRKRVLLEQGLSNYYVSLCFDAYREKIVSAPRLVEMLLLDNEAQLLELAKIYEENIKYAV